MKREILVSFYSNLKIVEEVFDEFKHEHMLLSVTGYDAAVLDSYVKFVQNAAQMTDVNLTKRCVSHHFLSFILDKTILICCYIHSQGAIFSGIL